MPEARPPRAIIEYALDNKNFEGFARQSGIPASVAEVDQGLADGYLGTQVGPSGREGPRVPAGGHRRRSRWSVALGKC